MREELSAIADALESIATGVREASIQLGQPDLGFGHCRVFQYGGPRRLGMDVLVGHAGGMISNGTDYPRRVHVAIPLERGQLAQCASDLHKIIIAERGSVRSSAPPDWPD